MKKIMSILTLSVFAFLSSGFATKAAISIDEVNAKVAAITAPFTTPTSAMTVRFTALKTDAVRTLDFGLMFSVWKKGSINELLFNLTKFDYHYDVNNPSLDIDAKMNLDLVTALGQSAINEIAVDLDKNLLEYAASYIQEYGPAVTVSSAVDQIIKDSNGDVESIALHFDVDMDLSQLPANITADQVAIKSMRLKLALSRTSASASAQVIMNPQYYTFSEDQMGLKELIDALLNDDPDMFNMMSDFAKTLDEIATSLVETHP